MLTVWKINWKKPIKFNKNYWLISFVKDNAKILKKSYPKQWYKIKREILKGAFQKDVLKATVTNIRILNLYYTQMQWKVVFYLHTIKIYYFFFVSEHLRSKFCCRESERYKFTWFFLKTFFSSWALSVKLERKQIHVKKLLTNYSIPLPLSPLNKN